MEQQRVSTELQAQIESERSDWISPDGTLSRLQNLYLNLHCFSEAFFLVCWNQSQKNSNPDFHLEFNDNQMYRLQSVMSAAKSFVHRDV